MSVREVVKHRVIHLMCLAALLYACNGEPTLIGSDLIDGSSIDLSYVDSITVNLSTIRLDSIVMSSAERYLVGRAKDDELGELTASTYTRLYPPGTLGESAKDKAQFIDARITLNLDGYSYYDTTTVLSLQVHRVTESIEPTEDGYYYNTQSFQMEETAIGTLDVKPRPNRTDSIEISLTPRLAAEMWSLYINGEDEMSTSAEFEKYFEGIRVSAVGAGTGWLLGVASIELRLYYLDTDETPVETKYVTFSSESGYTFSSVYGNLRTTNLSGLATYRDKVASENSNDLAFVQAGTGLCLRADMPYLRDLAKLTDQYLVKAELVFYPESGSFKDQTSLPSSLYAYVYDYKNAAADELTTTCQLIEDIELGRDTHYSLDVTDFVQSQIARQDFNSDGIVLINASSDFRSTVNRAYIADRSYTYRTGLKAYFVTINNK